MQENNRIREMEIALEREKLSKWTPEKVVISFAVLIIDIAFILAFFFLVFASYFSYNMFNTLSRVQSVETVKTFSDNMEMKTRADNGSSINITNSANRS